MYAFIKSIYDWVAARYSHICAIVREVNGDDNLRLSQMRLSASSVVFTIIGVFIWKNYQAEPGVMVDFPTNAAWLLVIVITGKVAQKFIERKWGGMPQAVEAINASGPAAAPAEDMPDEPCPKAP